MSLDSAKLKIWNEKKKLDDGLHVFLAKWCGYCQRLHPELVKVQEYLKSKNLKGLHLYDSDKGQPARPDMQVRGYPHMFLLVDNQVVDEPQVRDAEGIIGLLDTRKPAKSSADSSKKEDDLRIELATSLLTLLSVHPKREEILGLLFGEN